MIKTRQISALALAASVAMVLSGCGGGGSGGDGSDPPMQSMGGGGGGGGGGGDGGGGGGAGELPTTGRLIHHATQASPRPGSVTQGSAVLQGVTADTVHLSFVPHEGEAHPIASIDTGDGRTLTSNEVPRRAKVELPTGEILVVDDLDNLELPEGVTTYIYYSQEVYGLEEGGLLYYSPAHDEMLDQWREDGGGTSCSGESDCAALEALLAEISLESVIVHPDADREVQAIHLTDLFDGGSFALDGDDDAPRVIDNPSGMSVIGFTDYAGGGDDWLAWGYWAHYRFTPSDLEFAFGAFADGVETAFADVPVTGTASYAGYSSGIANTGGVSLSRDNFEAADDSSFEFVAEISLTANFGEHSVSGTVDNFRAIYYGDPIESELVEEALGDSGFLNDLRVGLGSANIISSGSDPAESFFEGTASATTGLDNATGKWGGQFFGTPDAGEAPPAVGGTWGISEGDGADDWKMLGGYGAWKGS